VVAGGPGTGKSWTVARLVAAAHLLAGSSAPRVALAAPTGKAAGRLAEALALAAADAEGGEEGALGPEVAAALRQVTVATVHTLLGSTGGLRFDHDHDDPLPYDLVVVDETSMVSLPLMARLLDAVRPEAGVVLVGDPYQLASVEVGTVMGDLVGPEVPASTGPLDGLVTVLSRRYRFAEDSAIAALGDAVRRGDADGALVVLASGAPGVAWVRDDQDLAEVEDLLVQAAAETVVAARAGEAGDALAASSRIKLLAATRRGPASVADWASRLEAGVVRRLGQPLRPVGGWFEGRPVLVTANDRANRLRNGDTGVALRRDGRLVVAFAEGDDQPRWVPVAALGAVDTWWSMTIHKAQGSEFEHAVVSLPAAGSPALSRELLYTAVTRGRRQVTVVASEEALRQAVERPVSRASGLGRRLWHGVP
jgi:exodeoxyribonuclease V alpha subunit